MSRALHYLSCLDHDRLMLHLIIIEFVSCCKILCVGFKLQKMALADITKICGSIVCYSEYSMQLNASRIKVLQAQDDVVNSMKEAASKELLNVSHDHNVYRKLLKDLIVQVSI